METTLSRRSVVAAAAAASLTAFAGSSFAQDKVKLRLSSPSSATDQRAVALTSVFAPAVADFAVFEPHWNAALFKQGTELEAISRGNLDMSIASAQELAEFFPEFSIFSAGYLHKDAAHQKRVFESDLFKPFKKMVEDKLGVKLLTVMYLGRRQINLRTDKKINTPEDLAGIKLRMPGSEAWMFLGRALGANPTPMAFTEVYTGLQTGAIDGQDNPLPNVQNMKFYEVMDQIVLTSHLIGYDLLVISSDAWNAMSAEDQEAFQAAASEAINWSQAEHIAMEEQLIGEFEAAGLNIYEPDQDAFRAYAQEQYLNSEISDSWPEGALEAINAL